MKQNQNNPTRWVSDTTLAEYFDVSRCTIWRWAKTGRLPEPQKLGENTTRWDFDAAVASILGKRSA
jgi:predicted DNA-binding transcriptional regulator AlpA